MVKGLVLGDYSEILNPNLGPYKTMFKPKPSSPTASRWAIVPQGFGV